MCRQSTVKQYLRANKHAQTFPNTMQLYLNGPMRAGMKAKLLFKAGFAPVQHLCARKCRDVTHDTDTATDDNSATCPICQCVDETAEHFALECPQFAQLCSDMKQTLCVEVGNAKYSHWSSLPDNQQKLYTLLDDQHWGAHANAVDHIAQQYLMNLLRERVARLQTTHSTHPAGTAGARAHGSSCYG